MEVVNFKWIASFRYRSGLERVAEPETGFTKLNCGLVGEDCNHILLWETCLLFLLVNTNAVARRHF